jgi:ankyrin repeat protein
MIRSKSTGFTVLHQAVECQNYDITDAILAKRQISINEQIDSGRSALHIAASNGSFHIIKLLVEKYHADVNISSKSGETPLSIAIQKNNEEIALYLARLATINVKPFGDKLCSELAVDRGLFSVCDELIKRKEAFNSEKGMELILSLDSLIKLNEYKKSISTNKAKNLIFSLLKRNFGMVAAEIINNFGLSEAESH